MKKQLEQLKTQIRQIFGTAGIKHSDKDIMLLIAICDQFNRSGYNLTYNEVADFLCNKKNRKLIDKDGLNKTIEAMASMKLGTITRKDDKIGRNDKCPCGSGNKYKKCCINK